MQRKKRSRECHHPGNIRTESSGGASAAESKQLQPKYEKISSGEKTTVVKGRGRVYLTPLRWFGADRTLQEGIKGPNKESGSRCDGLTGKVVQCVKRDYRVGWDQEGRDRR